VIASLPLPYPFETDAMQRALITSVAVGIFAPMIGTFLVQKRLSLIGDGVGHVAFAGIGAGLLLGVWPVWTALVFAIAGAVGVEWLRSRRKASGDLALALFFYTGIALGIVFASRAGGLDLETLPYLFGDPLAASAGEVWTILGLGALVVLGVWTLRRVLFAVVTDEDWSRVAGLPVDGLGMLLAGLTAAVIIAGIRVVGLLLVAALMVLPVASAQLVARSFGGTLRFAVAVGGASAFLGLVLGRLLHIAPGGAIVLVAAAVFAGVAIVRGGALRVFEFEAHR